MNLKISRFSLAFTAAALGCLTAADNAAGHETTADHDQMNHMNMSHGDDMTMNLSARTMASSINLAEPMNRESSGTAWVPDSTPIYGKMIMLGDDMLMLHSGAFPRYTNVSTRRGDDRIDLPNWMMAMFSHSLGKDAQLGLRAMMSLDPLTEGGRGYPLLYQSGESWQGQALHDRQHPHDLFAELSATYSWKFAHDFSGYLYFGCPGEPALGPPTFMHRLSAMDNPDAPIGHHWEDSSHITFGVATLGAVWRNVKLEGSVFTGREPNEDRYDFDKARFDSVSARLSWNPTRNLALQVSHGYLHSPEALEPESNQHRTSFSAIHNQPLGGDRNWSTSFVWGQDRNTGTRATHPLLLEITYQRGGDTIYARWNGSKNRVTNSFSQRLMKIAFSPWPGIASATCATSFMAAGSTLVSAPSSRSTTCRTGSNATMATTCPTASSSSCASVLLSCSRARCDGAGGLTRQGCLAMRSQEPEENGHKEESRHIADKWPRCTGDIASTVVIVACT